MRQQVIIFWAICLLAFLLTTPTFAMPLNPNLVERLKAEGRLQQEALFMREAYSRGVNQPPELRPLTNYNSHQGMPVTAAVQRNAIVILVDFSDNVADPGTYPPSHYDDMLFSEGTHPTGSMKDYYLENSYGGFVLSGTVTDWIRLAATYDFYVNGQRGFGTYPRNAQRLAEDAVQAADPYVDFSQFDNDGPDGVPNSGDDDGFVDALFIVHAGPGYEVTGDPNDIHSHQWFMKNPVTVDGVTAKVYSMEPEDGKIGVFCHEYGHVLGLPDLYDMEYNSKGLGNWSVMALGSWGNGGLTPVHFDAWSKSKIGFVRPGVIRSNTTTVPMLNAENYPVAKVVWTNGVFDKEYFIVENRQPILFDSYIGGSGLVIYHVDENLDDNNDQCCGSCTSHSLLAVEQADGECDLESNHNTGDPGDPFPGSGGTNNPNYTFDYSSTPSSADYEGNDTQVSISNITSYGELFIMDVVVETSPAIEVSKKTVDDGAASAPMDEITQAGEVMELFAGLYNYGIDAIDVSAKISTSDPYVTVALDSTFYGSIPEGATKEPAQPFLLDIAPSCPTPHGIPVEMLIRDYNGYSSAPSFFVGVGDTMRFYDWNHSRVTDGFKDEWHLTMEKNHTPGGTSCWKCGNNGPYFYSNSLDAALYTIQFYATPDTWLSFWYWIEAERKSSNEAWDGGVVEISVDSGPWEILVPEGGYPYTMAENPDSPFPTGMPCYSGYWYFWQFAEFDLSNYVGAVRIRFRFGSDSYTTARGWYIDDVSVINAGAISVAEAPGVPTRLLEACPNPFNPFTKIRYSVGEGAGRVRLQVYDVAGRLVRTLVDAPVGIGRHEAVWDGRDVRGREVASGAYICRMESDVYSHTTKIVLLR